MFRSLKTLVAAGLVALPLALPLAWALAWTVAWAVAWTPSTAMAQAKTQKPTVVELFTSQGCSSCPPADALLIDLSRRKDVLALSFHVDYWDYIGWKDPFASPLYTKRQRDYAGKFDLRYVYTPQMVIHGAHEAVGSKRAEVMEKIQASMKAERVGIRIMPGKINNQILVSVDGGGTGEEADILLVVFDKKHVTAVKRGENTGRTITNVNVVRSLQPIGSWNGAPVSIAAFLDDAALAKGAACAVLLQSRKSGRILGAARMDLMN